MMKVAVTGATGVIGREVVRALLARGDEVTVLSRDADRARRALGGVDARRVDRSQEPGRAPAEALAGRDAVIHLLGENVAQRWSDSAQAGDPRLAGARHAQPRRGPARRPSRARAVLVSQSASGYYGPRGDERVDESEPAGDDFLAGVVVGWEEQARRAEELGMRVVTTRTGVVLAEDGGALAKMLPFFKAGVGGPVAGGRQYVPWIHLDDVVGAILFCLDDERATGPVNLSAPEPVTNKELSKALGRVLRRPAFAPVPGFAVKALYGEMATIVTTGVRMVPARLQELGYEFRQPGPRGRAAGGYSLRKSRTAAAVSSSASHSTEWPPGTRATRQPFAERRAGSGRGPPGSTSARRSRSGSAGPPPAAARAPSRSRRRSPSRASSGTRAGRRAADEVQLHLLLEQLARRPVEQAGRELGLDRLVGRRERLALELRSGALEADRRRHAQRRVEQADPPAVLGAARASSAASTRPPKLKPSQSALPVRPPLDRLDDVLDVRRGVPRRLPAGLAVTAQVRGRPAAGRAGAPTAGGSARRSRPARAGRRAPARRDRRSAVPGAACAWRA